MIDDMIAELDKLSDKHEPTPQEEVRMAELREAIRTYEAEHDPLPELSPLELLAGIMEDGGHDVKKIEEETGVPVSLILEGKGKMTPKMQAALEKRFCLVEGALS